MTNVCGKRCFLWQKLLLLTESCIPGTDLYQMNDLGLVDRRLLAVACSHLKFFQDGGGRHLRFVRTGNSAIRCAVPENPTLEPNMGRIGRPVAEIWPFEMLVAFRFAICRFRHYPTLAPGGGWLFFALKYGLSVFVRQLCV